MTQFHVRSLPVARSTSDDAAVGDRVLVLVGDSQSLPAALRRCGARSPTDRRCSPASCPSTALSSLCLSTATEHDPTAPGHRRSPAGDSPPSVAAAAAASSQFSRPPADVFSGSGCALALPTSPIHHEFQPPQSKFSAAGYVAGKKLICAVVIFP